MKHLLLTTIAAVLLVGCGESQSPEPTKAKALDISIHDAAQVGNIEAVKQHLAAGTDVNVKGESGRTLASPAIDWCKRLLGIFSTTERLRLEVLSLGFEGRDLDFALRKPDGEVHELAVGCLDILRERAQKKIAAFLDL